MKDFHEDLLSMLEKSRLEIMKIIDERAKDKDREICIDEVFAEILGGMELNLGKFGSVKCLDLLVDQTLHLFKMVYPTMHRVAGLTEDVVYRLLVASLNCAMNALHRRNYTAAAQLRPSEVEKGGEKKTDLYKFQHGDLKDEGNVEIIKKDLMRRKELGEFLLKEYKISREEAFWVVRRGKIVRKQLTEDGLMEYLEKLFEERGEKINFDYDKTLEYFETAVDYDKSTCPMEGEWYSSIGVDIENMARGTVI